MSSDEVKSTTTTADADTEKSVKTDRQRYMRTASQQDREQGEAETKSE